MSRSHDEFVLLRFNQPNRTWQRWRISAFRLCRPETTTHESTLLHINRRGLYCPFCFEHLPAFLGDMPRSDIGGGVDGPLIFFGTGRWNTCAPGLLASASRAGPALRPQGRKCDRVRKNATLVVPAGPQAEARILSLTQGFEHLQWAIVFYFGGLHALV